MKHLYNLIFALAAVALLSLVHSNAFAQSSPLFRIRVCSKIMERT